MPSVSTINFMLNTPPSGGSMIIRPAFGDSIGTNFKIIMEGYTDQDAPLTYKFHVYLS